MDHRPVISLFLSKTKPELHRHLQCSSNPTIIRPSTKLYLPPNALNVAFGSHHGKSSNHNTNKYIFHNPTSPVLKLLTPLRYLYLRPQRNPHPLYSQCRQSMIDLNSVYFKANHTCIHCYLSKPQLLHDFCCLVTLCSLEHAQYV